MFEELLKSIKHKDVYKSTTTLKFKKDVIDILMNTPFDGDILEVGSNRGHTTAVLGTVAKILNKKVYAFEFKKELIKESRKLCAGLDCEFIRKDVYKEPWNVFNIGCIFIDCMHTEKCFKQDLENAFNIINTGGIVLAHDYGLVTPKGDKISNVIKSNPEYKIERFLGEKENWNELGAGKVIDWEGVQLKK